MTTDPASESMREIAAASGFRSVQSTPLRSRGGEPLGMLSTHHAEPYRYSDRDLRLLDIYTRLLADFIDRSRADAALRDSEARLGEENRHKDEYLAMLGHELRNPLAVIHSATELMQLAELEDPRLTKAVTVIERQSSHMARIIDGLLEVSRIARGKVDLEPRPLDLRDVVERVLDDRAEAISAHGLELVRPSAAEPLWIDGDETRLAQVFGNLVDNAVKFTPPPGTIEVSVARDGASAVVRVRDSGVGIRPKMLSRIFESFAQEAQDVARSAGGLGLGLALAKGLVDLHGGTIAASSDGPGTGAELEVRLPLREAPTTRRVEDSPPEVGPRRILVVEDNADAAYMLSELLQMEGHQVTTVDTGADALELLREHGADVVLCDLGLPGMSGHEVARAIRNDPSLRELPLVALTGYGQPEDRERSAAAGFDAHLVKPVSLPLLNAVLRRLAQS